MISDGSCKVAAICTLKILDPIVLTYSFKSGIDRNYQRFYYNRDQVIQSGSLGWQTVSFSP
jgi:hypothetical protein